MLNNKKQFILGLLVLGIGFGSSAFKYAEKKASVKYYQISLDQYTTESDLGDCNGDSTPNLPCSITYATDPGVSTPFTYANRPNPSAAVDSSEKNIYNP